MRLVQRGSARLPQRRRHGGMPAPSGGFRAAQPAISASHHPPRARRPSAGSARAAFARFRPQTLRSADPHHGGVNSSIASSSTCRADQGRPNLGGSVAAASRADQLLRSLQVPCNAGPQLCELRV
jgi:hypothetical protein